MITGRQSQILNAVIEEYIKNAIPVSSGAIFDIGILDVSCPTIRNEMADLTEMGYLAQPHTSAGRVPTESGYRFFVDKIISKPTKRMRKKSANKISDAAQELSSETSDIVLFIDDGGEVKHIGLNKVLRKPEFSTRNAVLSIIEELDRFEKYARDFEKEIADELEVFIGSENPFFENREFSMLASRPSCGFIALIGPMRMNYRKNLRLLEIL
jgi:heat-inducible transcriptional repressor